MCSQIRTCFGDLSVIWAVKRRTMSTTKFVYIRNQRVRYMTTKITKLLCYSTVVVSGNADSHQRRRNQSEKIQKIQKIQPRPNKHENKAFTYVCRRTSKNLVENTKSDKIFRIGCFKCQWFILSTSKVCQLHQLR